MPKLKELTPLHLRCMPSACPAAFKTEGGYVIIGKVVDAKDYPELAGRIGVVEQAVEVPAELIEATLWSKG